MMKINKTKISILLLMFSFLVSCGNKKETENVENEKEEFMYEVDEFADIQMLRYQVPGFEDLSLQQKEMIYYLSMAALEGRDILYDQNNKYNLAIRRTLEAIYLNYNGDKQSQDYKNFETYLKRVWFSNGIHHHYGEEKFVPEFSETFFVDAVNALPENVLPLCDGETKESLINKLKPVIFDNKLYAKKVNQSGDAIKNSANNYYGEDVTQAEVQAFYKNMHKPNDETPISYGLNSRLVKENGKLVEKVWYEDGLYGPAIKKINYWLQKAADVAENDEQRDVVNKLISFYKSGDLEMYDQYSIAWVNEHSRIDFVNAFVEVYGDALGIKASWESMVNFKNEEATKRTEIISSNAQWFEDNSPVEKQFKKDKVVGVSAKVITVAQLGGDCYPSTPIGVNLPNANWIRVEHGSKSVTVENIMEAYDAASKHTGFSKEFVWSDEEIQSLDKYGFMTDVLHTDLHECLGHGSGKILSTTPANALGEAHSTIEETRADLFGLYFLADPKLVELNILPNDEAYKAEYYKFMMNGLMSQLVRIELGKDVEESHMRNRQLIAQWVLKHGEKDNVVEFKQKDGKTYVVINDYGKLRILFGELLAEIQRITSEGDVATAKKLIEEYAVKVDPKLHKEVLDRYKTLNLKPYKGFVNPNYELVKNDKGEVIDVTVSYNEGYVDQMLRYSKDFSALPTCND